MLTCTDAFKTAVKADIRECKAKVVLNYSTPLTLTDEKIQSISITNTAEIALGGVENNDIRLTLMENALTDEQFNQDIDAEVFIGIVTDEENDTVEFISLGAFDTDGWGKVDKSGIVTVNLTSKINANATIPKNLVCAENTKLTDYAVSTVDLIFGKTLTVNGTFPDHKLSKSWLYYDNAVEQLKAFGMAINGLFRYVNGFELVPYKLTTKAVDTLKYGKNEAIWEINRVSDYSKNKKTVEILKSQFVESSIEKLASANLKTEGGTSNFVELKTGCPVNVNYVLLGNGYGQYGGVYGGIVSCKAEVFDSYAGAKHTIPVEIYGTKVESVLTEEKDTTDGTKTYIENPYIQTAEHVASLDTKIYNGICYSVKYRGNPCYQVGDVISVEGIGKLLIYKHNLEYSGGLTGILEGVLVEEAAA